MRPARSMCLAFVSCLAVASAARADNLVVDSHVDAATVFPGAVSVHRTARVRVGAGEHTVVFAPLPATLDDDSIRIGGFGAGATADGVSVRTGTRGELIREQLAGMQTQFDAMAGERALATQRLAALQASRGAPGALAELRARTAALATRSDLAATALQQARALAAQPVKFVSVDITTPHDGPLELALEYLVPGGANWRPAYAAHLDDARDRLGLDVFATLQQTTGEDWTDVRLAVSTVVPPSGLTLPQLGEAQLELAPPEQRVPRSAFDADPMDRIGARARPSIPAAGGFADASPAREATAEPVLTPIAMQTGQARAQPLAARIEIPTHVTLRSGATPRRVLAAHLDVAAGLEYRAAPSRSSAVYLVSSFANHAPFPLLAGRVALFVGDQYVGAASVPDVSIDEPVLLPFGADAGLALERTLAEHHATHTASRDETSVHYHFRLVNHRDRAASVIVFDRLPTSLSHAITVRTLAGSRAPDAHHDGDAPGVVRFVTRVEPGATSRWDFGYVVDAPRGRAVEGELP